MEDEFITVAVRDDGLGIDAKVAESLVEPYVTTKSKGLGMGLSIKRTILEAHGSPLWYDAKAEAGACLRFRLPLTEVADNG